ncbi:MAG: hypothetical protein ABIR32_00105 [Ilumatobacteraceae bacterium]
MTSTSGTPTDPARRAALNNLKLRALVRDHLGHEIGDISQTKPVPFGRGSALVIDEGAWVLLDGQPERGLGAALAWVTRQPAATRLAVITEAASGVLARRAELFMFPCTVWHAADRVLVPAVNEPYPEPAPIDPAHEALRPLIVEGGAEPLTEHGVLTGEVRGLEVCRAVTDHHIDEVRLEVGVGTHDREAFLMLHGARPTIEALADVVGSVSQHREVGAALHPLNRFGAERFLRWMVVHSPDRVGASSLRAVDPPVVRSNIKDPVPCVALGEADDGKAMVVVCSTGIDLDLVPFAVDARQMHAPDAELVIVVPPRDVSPVTIAIAAMAVAAPRIVAWD